jgi:2-C-methyl-D-erythritol 4-phosphate cytidylyltransferase
MKKHVIIVAGGSGKRMGTDIPKQFLLLKGKPILMHTIERFSKFDSEINIVVVLPEQQIDYWNSLVKDHRFNIEHKLVKGGEERFYSVKNGLESIYEKDGIVAIHDGVRPCVSNQTIATCFREAEEKGNAIPYADITESIRYVDKSSSYIVDRSKYKTIQTPQVFDLLKIKNAYKTEFKKEFTDDASVFEEVGYDINLVLGNNENIKITTPFDLELAAKFIE